MLFERNHLGRPKGPHSPFPYPPHPAPHPPTLVRQAPSPALDPPPNASPLRVSAAEAPKTSKSTYPPLCKWSCMVGRGLGRMRASCPAFSSSPPMAWQCGYFLSFGSGFWSSGAPYGPKGSGSPKHVDRGNYRVACVLALWPRWCPGVCPGSVPAGDCILYPLLCPSTCC